MISQLKEIGPVKLIMFDVDGTLTDTCEAEVRLYVPAVREALGIAEIDTDWSTYKNYTDPGVTSEVVERAWGRQATPEELARVCARWLELVDEDFAKDPDACRAIPGARRIIEAVRRRADCAISIATGCWYFDIHPNKTTLGGANDFAPEKHQPDPYDIPFASLVPVDVDNLLVAGRCHSATRGAQSSTRVTVTAMALGEAAGTAAALASAAGTDVGRLDGREVRGALAKRGAGPFTTA